MIATIRKQMDWMSFKFLLVLGILFFLITLYYSYPKTAALFQATIHMDLDNTRYSFFLLLCSIIIILCLILAVAHGITKYLTRWQFTILLIMITSGIRLYWVLTIPTQPTSDFIDMHNAAKDAAMGNFLFGETDYFSRWVHQLGFTMYQALLIKLFGKPLVILKVVNILLNVGIAVLIYLMAAKVFNEFCGRIASFLYAVYIPSIIMCSVLSNQHLSTFLFALGCYLLINQGLSTSYNWIFIGICFGFGNIIRPLGSFFIGCFVIYVVIVELLPTLRSRGKAIIRKSLGVLVVFFVIQQLVSYSFIYMGVTSHTLASKEPYWKFVVGLNPNTTGTWSEADEAYVKPYKLGLDRNQAELELIKERAADRKQLLLLFANKFKMMWGDEDTSVFWSLWGLEKQNLQQVLQLIERVEFLIMALFGLISISSLFIKNNYPNHFLLQLLLLGYAALHLIIEIQTRYRFDIMFSFIILQSYGIFVFYTLLFRTTRNKTSEVHNQYTFYSLASRIRRDRT